MGLISNWSVIGRTAVGCGQIDTGGIRRREVAAEAAAGAATGAAAGAATGAAAGAAAGAAVGAAVEAAVEAAVGAAAAGAAAEVAEAAVVVVQCIARGRSVKGRRAQFLLFSYIKVKKAVNKPKEKY